MSDYTYRSTSFPTQQQMLRAMVEGFLVFDGLADEAQVVETLSAMTDDALAGEMIAGYGLDQVVDDEPSHMQREQYTRAELATAFADLRHAWRALVPMQRVKVTITARGAESTVPDRDDAVDAWVEAVGGDTYEITLLVDHNGDLTTWGPSLEYWAGGDLGDVLGSMTDDDSQASIDAIVNAVAAANASA